MTASPAERFRWDMTRRWRCWAQAGDLTALQTDATRLSSRVELAHVAAALVGAAGKGQLAVVKWLLDEQHRRWPHTQAARAAYDWVAAAARGRHREVLTFALGLSLASGPLRVALTALVRLGLPKALLRPYLDQASLVHDDGAFLTLLMRTPGWREAALARLTTQLPTTGEAWVAPVAKTVQRLLTQGRAQDAQAVLAVAAAHASRPALWVPVEAWLRRRSHRTQQRWCAAWHGCLPQTQIRVREVTLARSPASIVAHSRPRA